jgi:hypothetical protein
MVDTHVYTFSWKRTTICFIGVFVFVDIAEAAAVAVFTDTSVDLEKGEDTTAIDMSKITNLLIARIIYDCHFCVSPIVRSGTNEYTSDI